MLATKKKIICILLLLLVIAAVFALYRTVGEPKVVPKLGEYSCESELGSGSFVLASSKDFTIEPWILSSFSELIEKHYGVERSLLHGDIVVVDWLKDKKLKFKVTSDTSLVVLDDCGYFEKGKVYTLKKKADKSKTA